MVAQFELSGPANQGLTSQTGTRGKGPGRGGPTRLCQTVADPACSAHVGAGEDHPFGPATRQAGGPGRERAPSREGLPRGQGVTFTKPSHRLVNTGQEKI